MFAKCHHDSNFFFKPCCLVQNEIKTPRRKLIIVTNGYRIFELKKFSHQTISLNFIVKLILPLVYKNVTPWPFIVVWQILFRKYFVMIDYFVLKLKVERWCFRSFKENAKVNNPLLLSFWIVLPQIVKKLHRHGFEVKLKLYPKTLTKQNCCVVYSSTIHYIYIYVPLH